MTQGNGNEPFDAVIVGAGFGGMYMLHHLRELGFSTLVIERADGVGAPGIGIATRAPGAMSRVSCIPTRSPKNSNGEWHWSEKYPTQSEILRYANHVADRFDLRRDIRFETGVEKAKWDDDAGRWVISLSTGEDLTAQYYVMATG